MYKRNITQDFLESLQDTPVLLLNGARQAGKSTLVKSLIGTDHQYYTMDDPTTLSSIKKDPLMFLEGLTGPTIFDEVQRTPELFLPLKKVVDNNKIPGYFVLTGSANILSLPRIADSLAGRIEIHTLWPLSQGEIEGHKEDFINTIFNKELPLPQKHISLEDLVDRLITGGYPAPLQRSTGNRQQKWFSSYLSTILEKDIRELSNIEGLTEIPSLMHLCAARCGTLLNMTEFSRSLGLAHSTLKRYLTLLEKTYLLVSLPAWSKNLSKRLVKTPKIYLNDTGLLTHLVDFNKTRLLNDKNFLGHVLENFVVMELKKQMTWSQQRSTIYHYRTHSQKEVDIILEAPDSRVIGIEVKLAHAVSAKDFDGINSLEEDIGPHLHRGIVFYMGREIIPFGRNKHALPLSLLWES